MRFTLSYDDGLDFQEFIIAYNDESEVYCYLSHMNQDDLWLVIVSDNEDDEKSYMAADEWMDEH